MIVCSKDDIFMAIKSTNKTGTAGYSPLHILSKPEVKIEQHTIAVKHRAVPACISDCLCLLA